MIRFLPSGRHPASMLLVALVWNKYLQYATEYILILIQMTLDRMQLLFKSIIQKWNEWEPVKNSSNRSKGNHILLRLQIVTVQFLFTFFGALLYFGLSYFFLFYSIFTLCVDLNEIDWSLCFLRANHLFGCMVK